MKNARFVVTILMCSATLALTGCGQLLDKLRGGVDAGSDAAADDAGAVVETDAAADLGDAAADAAAPVTNFHAGDNIPTFSADNAQAAKDITPANYKTELVNLDKEVKAQK